MDASIVAFCKVIVAFCKVIVAFCKVIVITSDEMLDCKEATWSRRTYGFGSTMNQLSYVIALPVDHAVPVQYLQLLVSTKLTLPGFWSSGIVTLKTTAKCCPG